MATPELDLVAAIATQGLGVIVAVYLLRFVTNNIIEQMNMDRANANAQHVELMNQISGLFTQVLNKLDSNEKQYMDTCAFVKQHDKQAGIILTKLEVVEKNTNECLRNVHG